MPSTPAFAHIQPGLLPTGTVTSYGEIVAVSCTAYKVADGRWLSYDTFHGRPAPVMPLVVLR
jgi:hypothetical protein